MLDINCVKHNYNSYLWVPDDLVEVAEKKCLAARLPLTKAKNLSFCLRVLEVRKDFKLKELDERGVSEEELTEEMLWLDIEWPRLSRFSLRFCGASSLQKIFPVVMQSGFARQRYIKRHPKSGARVCDEDGTPLIWNTYEAAQLDTEKHPGRIIHQALFESEALQAEIDRLDRPAPSTPSRKSSPLRRGEDPASETKTKNEGAQRNSQTGSPAAEAEQPPQRGHAARVGNKHTAVSNRNITPPSPKNQGIGTFAGPLYQHGTVAGTSPAPRDQGVGVAVATLPPPSVQDPAQKGKGSSPNDQSPSPKRTGPLPGGEDPLRQTTNHKDITTKRESQHMEKETNKPNTCAAGAVCGVDISLFDFFQPWSQIAIMDLLALVYPLPAHYGSTDSEMQTVQLYEETTSLLVADPHLQSRGLVFAARLMYYFKDESSPCQWRPKLRALRHNPNLVMQPWHMTAKTVPIAASEMERADWWPPELSPTLGLQNPASATNTLANANSVLAEITVLDLAELAGIAPDQRQGMPRQDAIDLVADIRTALPEDEFPGVFADYGAINRWQKARGYSVELWPANGLKLVLYSDADFERVVSCVKWLGTPELRERLKAACADAQVV